MGKLTVCADAAGVVKAKTAKINAFRIGTLRGQQPDAGDLVPFACNPNAADGWVLFSRKSDPPAFAERVGIMGFSVDEAGKKIAPKSNRPPFRAGQY
jgi:hypothetical protein